MRLILKIAFLTILSTSCYADKADQEKIINPFKYNKDPHFNIAFGLSPYIGVIGFEYLTKNHSISVGLPGMLSYRYYFKPYEDSKYWGVYLGGFNGDGLSRTVNGVLYDKVKSKFTGVGIGYRWQWYSGWNINASISLNYTNNKYTNPGSFQTTTEKEFSVFPGLNAGYQF
jgi:hypothetical protein